MFSPLGTIRKIHVLLTNGPFDLSRTICAAIDNRIRIVAAGTVGIQLIDRLLSHGAQVSAATQAS